MDKPPPVNFADFVLQMARSAPRLNRPGSTLVCAIQGENIGTLEDIKFRMTKNGKGYLYLVK